MNFSPTSPIDALVRALPEGLRRELRLTPKPGLVDLLDRGSHPDLDIAVMERSIDLLEEYFADLAFELGRVRPHIALKRVGLKAERRMLDTLGTNTHKGAIFLGGLLMAARSAVDGDEPDPWSAAAAQIAKDFFSLPSPTGSHGEKARARYHVSGIVGEALAGLPSLFHVAHPAYRQQITHSGDPRTASWFMMSRLMQCIEDTTALHRCGPPGLAKLRRDGRWLEEVILSGRSPLPLLHRLNAEYRSMNLTMGGVADMIGLTFAYLEYQSLRDAERLAPAAAVGAIA